MKKYATIATIFISALSFSSVSWAHDTGIDAEGDALYGHGAVPSSAGQKYVRSEARSNEQGDDLLRYREDYSQSSPYSGPAQPAEASHDNHEDQLHAIAHH